MIRTHAAHTALHVLQVPDDQRSQSQLACLAETISDSDFFKRLQFSKLILAQVCKNSALAASLPHCHSISTQTDLCAS